MLLLLLLLLLTSTACPAFSTAAGASPNHPGASGNSALHYAAADGNEQIVRTLIAHGGDIRIKNNRGETPLDLACWLDPSTVPVAKLQFMLRPALGNRDNYRTQLARASAADWIDREGAKNAGAASGAATAGYFKAQHKLRMRKHKRLGSKKVTFPGPATYNKENQPKFGRGVKGVLSADQLALLARDKKQMSLVDHQGTLVPNARYPAAARPTQVGADDPGFCAVRTCTWPVGGRFDIDGRFDSKFCREHGGGR